MARSTHPPALMGKDNPMATMPLTVNVDADLTRVTGALRVLERLCSDIQAAVRSATDDLEALAGQEETTT